MFTRNTRFLRNETIVIDWFIRRFEILEIIVAFLNTGQIIPGNLVKISFNKFLSHRLIHRDRF